VTVVAVLGLGEAGGTIAADLRAAGAEVRGYDVLPERTECADAAAAAAGADVVLSLSSAATAVEAARAAAPALREGQVFADLNSAAPARKREVAGVVAPAAFADVALMAPVPGRGLRTPALAAGPGAQRFAALLGPLGLPVEVVGDEIGAAAARKLLRSVFMKGLAASVLEATAAASAAGCEDWMREQIGGVIDPALAERLLSGSRIHAARRVQELDDASALLRELGVAPHVCVAARRRLEALRDDG
jgi:3-hydroxyisobutyrate dehydrogenase-like beta-hydroxyacid dehydrogenase